VASIATGLIITLALETAAYLKVFSFPAGVTASAGIDGRFLPGVLHRVVAHATQRAQHSSIPMSSW